MCFSDQRNDIRQDDELERAFWTLLRRARGGLVDEVEFVRSLGLVEQWASNTAKSLHRKWHISAAAADVNDTVQKWFVELYAKGWQRCDTRRSIVGLAYTILRRCCTSVVKREARSPFCRRETDAGDEKPSWSEAMEHTEMLDALSEAVPQLPPGQRAAIELSLAHKRANERIRFRSAEERRNHHGLTCHARRRLKAIILARFDASDGDDFVYRIN